MSRQASGLMAWLIQRVTAVYLGLFSLYLILQFTFAAPADVDALRTWVAQPLIAAALLLFVPVLLAHAWVGIRDVLLDYVHVTWARITLLSLFAFTFVTSGLWAVKAIITAGLGE